jgi:uncharacterized protein (DUF58 family)
VILFNKYWDDKLDVELKFKDKEIFEGDSTELIEEIRRNKLLPVWWLGIQVVISRFIIFSKEEELKPRTKESRRKDFFTMLSYEKLTKKLKITVFKRGYYKIEDIVISSGDLFNIYKYMKTKSFNVYLTVYPRLINTPELKVLLKRLTGEVIVKRHIIEDPFTFRGIRDYTINDSLKLVNWSATAKGGELKVNQYDYTASQEVLILVNTERFNFWDSDFLTEESIRLAASIAAEYIENGVPVGITINSPGMIRNEETSLQPRSGKANLSVILETLARLDVKNSTRKMKDILEAETRSVRKNYSIILLSHYYDVELLNEFNMARAAGTHINWILPKLKNEEAKIEEENNIPIWEVSEDERRIF